MEFRILGSLEVWTDGRHVPVARGKPQALLMALLLEAGRTVSAERLVDGLWGIDPPATALGLVQTHVSVLRRALRAGTGVDPIITQAPGYRVDLQNSQVDLAVFEGLVADGRRAAAEGRYADAAQLLTAGLALWRGPALGAIGESFLCAEAARLDEMRLTVLEERVAAELELGRNAELVAELTGLVSEHPLRERLRGQLMTALYRAGRQSAALDVYRAGRDALADELGLDPGPELQRIHEEILRADAPQTSWVTRVGKPAAAAPASSAVVTPHQMPPAIADLTGRDAELDNLRGVLLDATSGLTPVCAISGMAGSGKSALALFAAHAARSAFPDGQLYANLRGTASTPVEPGEALGWFLRGLGIDDRPLPDSTAERTALYRSVLAGRRVLVVLDNAASEHQVRSLLPGVGGSAVLITSRAALPGLEGAEQVSLDVLEPEFAVELLGRIAGPPRIAAAADAAQDIVRLCGYLPLAVRAAGARLASRQQLPLPFFATRLGDERRRLDELAVGDLEVRASVKLSYQGLLEVQRAAFRRLGLLAVPDFAPWVVAPLLDMSVAAAEQIVERLADAQLLDFAGVDPSGQVRYRCHDLLRLYARERAEAEESRGERDDAVQRLLGWWLGLIDRAAELAPSGVLHLRRHASPGVHEVPAALAEELLTDPSAWFEAERCALVVAVERASELGLHTGACDIAAALLSSTFVAQNLFEDWWRTHDAALKAARLAGNRLGEAVLLAGLGQLRHEQDNFAESCRYFQQAIALFHEISDVGGEAVSLAGLGNALREHGHFAEALHVLERAGALFGELGDCAGKAAVGYGIGFIYRETGELAQAHVALDEALAAYRNIGNRRGEALTLRSIGLVHRAAGELSFAAQLCGQALDIFREMGDELLTAYGIQAVAKVRIRQGRGMEVLASLTACLATCRNLADDFGAALVQRTVGELYLASGFLDEAECYLAAALQAFDKLSLPLFRARTLRDLSTLRDKRGEPAAAVECRREALAIFRTFGSREQHELQSRVHRDPVVFT